MAELPNPGVCSQWSESKGFTTEAQRHRDTATYSDTATQRRRLVLRCTLPGRNPARSTANSYFSVSLCLYCLKSLFAGEGRIPRACRCARVLKPRRFICGRVVAGMANRSGRPPRERLTASAGCRSSLIAQCIPNQIKPKHDQKKSPAPGKGGNPPGRQKIAVTIRKQRAPVGRRRLRPETQERQTEAVSTTTDPACNVAMTSTGDRLFGST